MKVDLFVPCFIDQLYPDTVFNVIRVLDRAGMEVNYNPEQTCCGQPAFNSGHWDEARKLAVKFLDDFDGTRYIVGPSASCTAYIRNHFGKLLRGSDPLLAKYETVRPKMYEFSDFLVNVARITSLQSFFPHRATYHDACSALREYGIREEPRILLRNVKGLELSEMKETEVCCGFGGTFSVKFNHLSGAMTACKVENALNTGAEYIISTEASCMMNLESYIRKHRLPLKTIHLADVLASVQA